FILSLSHHPPLSTLFPYTTLFRSARLHRSMVLTPACKSTLYILCRTEGKEPVKLGNRRLRLGRAANHPRGPHCFAQNRPMAPARDRKSTRLNSSHDQISYAVFCLK